jgi:ketose-bisphosphate aldolase
MQRADKEGFAVPAFNFSDMWDLTAIIKAAEEEKSPVIVSANEPVMEVLGIELVTGMFRAVEKEAKVPVALHLDHFTKPEMAEAAVKCGFPSVMFDGSKLPLKENIELTSRIVKLGRSKDVFIEGEIGVILKADAAVEGGADEKDGIRYTEVEEARVFAKGTGVDSMAIAIGTAHGFYKTRPELNFKRLDEINKAVKVYLVLHGGTGIPDEDIRKAVKLGINKVNVGTVIHCTYMNELKAELDKRGRNPYTLDVMPPVVMKVKEVVAGRIRVCGSNGKIK